MADNDDNILFRFKVDTGELIESVNTLDKVKKKTKEVADEGEKSFTSYKAAIKAATNEAAQLEKQYGKNSQQFVDGAKKVAKLKDEFDEFNKSIGSFNPDNKFQSFISIANGSTKAIQGVSGAFQFLGVESDDASVAIAKLQGLMAFSNALGSIDDIKNGFEDFGRVAKDTYQQLVKYITTNTVAQTENIVATEASAVANTELAAANQAAAIATTEASTATKVFRTALISTGIGALIIGIGLLIANLDDVKEALGFTSQAQEDYNATVKDFNSEAAKSIEKVNSVKVAFDLARAGVISKKDALKKYNDTLGDSLGKTTSLAQAEKNLTDKADAYIKITALKAQANALFAKSAEYSANALTAQNEDQVSFFGKAKTLIAQYVGGNGAAIATALDEQAKGVAKVKEEAGKNSEVLQKQGEDLLKQAGEISKAFDVNGNVVGNKEEKDKKEKKDGKTPAELEKERQLAIIEAEKKTNEIVQAGRRALIKDDFTRKQQEIADEQQIKLDAAYDDFNKQKISKKQLEEQKLGITELYAQKQNDLLKEKREADAKAVLEDQKKTHDDLVKSFEENKALADANVIKTTRENQIVDRKVVDGKVVDEGDTPEQAKTKIENVLQAKQDAEQKSYEKERLQNINNKEELTRIEEQHQTNLINLNKDASDAKIAIDQKEKEAKASNLKAYGTALGQLGDLLGKQTVAGKAMAVAQTTIDTYQSATSAYKSLAGIPIVGPALGAVAAAAAVAAGIANVKKIVAVKVPGKDSGGGSAIPTATAPVINSTQLATPNSQPQDVRVTNLNDKPQRAYITQRDLDENAERKDFLNNLGGI